MTSVSDLIGMTYDLLFKNINVGANTYLQLAWPGITLSPVDFKNPDNPTGPYDPGYAEETFSFLSNIVPELSATNFNNTGFEIDDLYQLLITGAIPLGVPTDQWLTNPAYKLFSDAQFEFGNAQRGSRKDPGVFYYPCRATPSDWYTETNAQSWTTFSINASQPVSSPAASTFAKLGGNALLNKGIWRLKPDGLNEQNAKMQLNTTIKTKETIIHKQPVFSGNKTIVKPLESNKLKVLRDASPGVLPLDRDSQPVAQMKASQLQQFARLNGSVELKKKLRPDPLLSSSKLDTNLINQVRVDPGKLEVIPTRNLTFNKQLMLNSLLNEQLIPQKVSDNSTNFSISFKYARIMIDRPWLKLALLNTRNWYMFGTAASEYSTGTITNNPGMFSMLPISFIAIRDLKISANWATEDRASLSRSAAFGPFSTRGHVFNQNVLQIPGLQLIASVSRLMPALPPQKDPSLP